MNREDSKSEDRGKKYLYLTLIYSLSTQESYWFLVLGFAELELKIIACFKFSVYMKHHGFGADFGDKVGSNRREFSELVLWLLEWIL